MSITNGQWEVKSGREVFSTEKHPSGTNVVICDCAQPLRAPWDRGEVEANASAIAAIPEMMKALKMVVSGRFNLLQIEDAANVALEKARVKS